MNKKILRSPFFIWLNRLLKNSKLEFINRDKKLSLGYMSVCTNIKFGFYNKTYANVHLTNVEIGDFTYIAENSKISNCKIGKYCSIGPDVMIGLGKHPSRMFVSSHPVFYSTNNQTGITFTKECRFNEYESINIGHDVWIGARAIVLDGVSIGHGAIIAAAAVVTKDVAPYSIVGGSPAKEIRKRFDGSQIDFLIQFKWWDKNIEWVQNNYQHFNDINKFISQHTHKDLQ